MMDSRFDFDERGPAAFVSFYAWDWAEKKFLLYIYIYIYACVCVSVCVYVCEYVCVWICVCVCVCIYLYMI